MVDAHADHIAADVGDAIANLKFKPPSIKSPRDAAMAVMDLMNFCHTTLTPETICEVYNNARPGTHKSASKDKKVLDALWDHCGQQTIEVIAAGAVTLAAIWQAAWELAGQPDDSAWLSKSYDGTTDLMPIYEEENFLRSLHLQYLGKDDLPGSDAPTEPPPPPSGGANIDERGHQPKRGSAPAKPSAHRATGAAVKTVPRRAPARKHTKR
jgi:hypothetical protein